MERNGHTGSWWLSSLGDRTTADSRGGDNGICHLDIRDENGDCTFHWHRLNGLVDQRRDCRGSVGILLIEFADGLERSRGLYENIDFRGKNTSLCRLHLLQFLNGGRGSVHHFRLVGVVLSYTAAFNLVKVVPIVNTPKMKLGLKNILFTASPSLLHIVEDWRTYVVAATTLHVLFRLVPKRKWRMRTRNRNYSNSRDEYHFRHP